jgi:hypothetical protein
MGNGLNVADHRHDDLDEAVEVPVGTSGEAEDTGGVSAHLIQTVSFDVEEDDQSAEAGVATERSGLEPMGEEPDFYRSVEGLCVSTATRFSGFTEARSRFSPNPKRVRVR